MPASFDELLQTLEWVSFDSYPQNEAYVSRATARIARNAASINSLRSEKFGARRSNRGLDSGISDSDSKFMRNASKIALFLMSFAPSVASPQNCGDLQTQAEMNQCAAADYAKVDRELNKVYNAYRSSLDDEQKRQLRDAQLAWIRFRDLSCAFESSGVKGGSIHPLILQSCLAAMTRARIGQLSALAACKEGDLSCPAWK